MCYSPWGCKGSDILNDFHFHAAYSNCWHDPHGETVETMSDFVFWGSKITADGVCIHEIKIHLLLGRRVMTKRDSILKIRDSTLSTKVHIAKSAVFPGVMYRCEGSTIKKAECRRIDALNCGDGEDS